MRTDRAGLSRPMASLWRLPGYGWFYLAATLARLADEMLAIAVVLLVLDRTSSAALAGATVAAASLPSVLTGPVLGAWLDRTRHRRAALAANQVLLASTLLGLLLAAGRAPGWVVPALAVAGGIGAPMLTGGITSMIPLLVPHALLPRANALEAASFNTAAVLGPALAATVTARFGPATAVALEAGIALLGLAAIARMPPVHAAGGPEPATDALSAGSTAGAERSGPALQPGRAGPIGGAEPPASSLGGALRAGLAHLVRTPVLRGVTVTTSLAMGAQGLLPVALPLLSERLGAGRGAAGYLFAAQEVGAIAGALLAVRVAAWPAERIVMGGTAVVAAGTAGLALVPSFPVAVAVAAATGLAAGPAFAALFAVRQQWSPAGVRAHIFTTGASLKIGAYAVGAALAGPTLAGVGPRGAVVATAAAEVVAVISGLAASRSRSPAITGLDASRSRSPAIARRPAPTDAPRRSGDPGDATR
jgi:MFS family permease